MPGLDDEHLHKKFNDCHYNAWCRYSIAHTLTSDGSLGEETINTLVKEFGKGLPVIGAQACKLRKAMTVVIPIRGVRRDMAKYLETCVYNPAATFDSKHGALSLPKDQPFPQLGLDADVVYTRRASLLPTLKLGNNPKVTSTVQTGSSSHFSGQPRQAMLRIEQSLQRQLVREDLATFQ